MSPSGTIAIGLLALALQASAAMAQYKAPPGGLPGASMPGGSPGTSAPMPMPMPAPAPAPSITVPPPSMTPDVRAPVIVVPPPPAQPDRSRDGGGTAECDCYRMVDGKRVLTGKNVACCPK
jgi:hypothetical protein